LDLIKDLSSDGGFNCKNENANDALLRLAPEGIDIYYDNVGCEQLEAAITAMNNWGRISMPFFYLLNHTDWLMWLLVA
jgi:NADPH-dependent curcumin reductase CurA